MKREVIGLPTRLALQVLGVQQPHTFDLPPGATLMVSYKQGSLHARETDPDSAALCGEVVIVPGTQLVLRVTGNGPTEAAPRAYVAGDVKELANELLVKIGAGQRLTADEMTTLIDIGAKTRAAFASQLQLSASVVTEWCNEGIKPKSTADALLKLIAWLTQAACS